MTYAHLRELLKETRYSPEQLGGRIGVSGMTIRRWSEHPAEEQIPDLYEKALHEVIYELVAESVLSEDSAIVRVVLKESDQSIFNAAIRNLGFSPEFMKSAKPDTQSVVIGIAQIGAHTSKQESVDRSSKKILSFSKLGSEWKFRVRTLYSVVKSKELTTIDKFAAYGALFYLLTPFDLIPDSVPVFGLVDDFFILGIVTIYYLNRFPKLFKKNELK